MTLFDDSHPKPRATSATVELRTAQVIRWLQSGMSRGQIVYEAGERWGIAPRTVDTYLARARDMIEDAARTQTREHIAHRTGLGRPQAPVDGHADTQPLPEPDEPLTLDELTDEVGGWIRRQYFKADVAGDTRAGLQAAGQMAKLYGLNFDDRMKDKIKEGLEKDGVDPLEALQALLKGARESRETRGLPVGHDQDSAAVLDEDAVRDAVARGVGAADA